MPIDTGDMIQSSRTFVAGFIPPDYHVDGVLQRRFIYSLTAPTGGGKTAILLLLAANTALGYPIGDHHVEKGRVLYLAGENPDDIRMRWIAMAQHLGFDINTISVHFIPGVFSIDEMAARVRQESDELGGFDLIIVDTSAAYFPGNDENDNVQMGAHARRLRTLTTMPGNPCVIVACHPVKNAGNDNLLPRGGGAFIAEVDGNLVCLKRDTIVDLSWQGKFRGPEFEPVGFELRSVNADKLKDKKGRSIHTVLAQPLSEQTRSEIQSRVRSDEDELLLLLQKTDRTSIASIAEALGWFSPTGKPYKTRAQRGLNKLRDEGFVKLERGRWRLTDKGQKEADRVAENIQLAGARC